MLAIVCAVWPATAHAQSDIFDWLQPGSGPGPYRSSVGLFTRLFCVKEEPVTQRAATPANGEPDVQHHVTSCLDDTDPKIKIVVDLHYGHVTSHNPRFNDPVATLEPLNIAPITVDHFDVSYSYRVSPLLDVGIALGSYTYSGEGFSTTSRLTLTPLHVSFVPLGYLRGTMGRRWGRVLRLNYWNRRIVGDTVASDFGSRGSYVVRGEFSQGIAVSADFWSFISYAFTKR